MPSKVNTNFPYHVKTTQIGILSDNDDDNSPQGSSSSYTNIDGVYWTSTGPNLDFFTTAKSAPAGHEAGPMYGPIESRLGEPLTGPSSSRTNDSPPPPYPQVSVYRVTDF